MTPGHRRKLTSTAYTAVASTDRNQLGEKLEKPTPPQLEAARALARDRLIMLENALPASQRPPPMPLRTNLLPQCRLLIARHATNLGVPVLHDQIGDELYHQRKPLIESRLRKEPVHQGQKASTGWRERRLGMFAHWPTVATGHSQPLPAAERHHDQRKSSSALRS